MSELHLPQAAGRKAGFSWQKNHFLHIDMTPMVDLGFLLIAFFIYTARLSEPVVTTLRMPDDTSITTEPNNLSESLALTLLLDANDRIFYYHGKMNDAIAKKLIQKTSFSLTGGIGSIIREKQEAIDKSKKFPEGRKGLMLLIKPTGAASYKNLVDALDEALINDVKKYAIVEPAKEEILFITNAGNAQGFNSSR